MADFIIEVDENYIIKVNTETKNHEVCEDLHKTQDVKVKDKVTKEETIEQRPVFRSVGHYSNVRNALSGVYKDMCNMKSRNKKSNRVSIQEYIKDVEETTEYITNLLKEKFPKL